MILLASRQLEIPYCTPDMTRRPAGKIPRQFLSLGRRNYLDNSCPLKCIKRVLNDLGAFIFDRKALYFTRVAWPWRQGTSILRNSRKVLASRNTVTSLQIWIFSNSALKTSNLELKQMFSKPIFRTKCGIVGSTLTSPVLRTVSK
jgi:hypothetical protein